MESETGQLATMVSIPKLSELIMNMVNDQKFQKTAEIIERSCEPTLNLVIAEILKHIAEGNVDDWTLERALEEMADRCSVGAAPESTRLSLMRCAFDMMPRSDWAKMNCCWHSKEFFRQNLGVHYNVLITNWILEECFGLVDRFDKAYYEGHNVLMNLIECGLFEIEEDNVFMKELACGVPDSRYNGFIWKPSLGLSGVYEDKQWLDLESLGPDDGMIKTYEDMEKVSVLLVDGNHLGQEVIETYFSTLNDLQVLAIFRPRINELPVNLTKLRELCFLVLKDCDLLEKIDGLENLKALTVLEISNAKNFKVIPINLFDSLSKLRSLNLSKTGIEELPLSLSKLHELRSINLRECFCLKSLPMLKKLEKLQLLDVSGATSLERLADKSIGALQDLQLLDLSRTKVGHVPFLKKLEKLSRVSYKDCKELIRLPNLRDLSGLQVLDLSGAIMLKEIQDDTFPEKNDLKVLDLSRTEISYLPSSIFNLSNLELLNLSEMVNLDQLEDDTFKNMACLRHLNLSKSIVVNLPSLSGLVNLRELKLQECRLQTLPSLIALKKLQVLDLSGCDTFVQFEDESFCHMTHLRILNLSKTKIKKLPGLFGLDKLSKLLLIECINLTKLPSLSSSQLKELNAFGAKDLKEWEAELPEDMSRLEILNLSGTGLKSPPLNKYTNLRELSLSDCKLQMPLKLDNLTKLEVLDLSRTLISSLENITKLVNLRKLLLTGCSDLKEIPILEPLVKLEDLRLQETGIRTLPCQMAKFTRLMHLDLPESADTLGLDWTGIQSLPGELNWEQCGWLSNLQMNNNRLSMIVRNMDTFKILKGVPDIWNSCFSNFFISVCPLKEEEQDGEICVLRDGISSRDIYFHITSYQQNYAPFLEIRRFESFPTGLEDAIMKVDYVSLVENGFIRSLSELGNANNLKGCWIWSCTNLENIMQEDKDNAKLSELPDKDNAKLSEHPDKDNAKLSELPDKDSAKLSEHPDKDNAKLSELPDKDNAKLSEHPDKDNAKLSEHPDKDDLKSSKNPDTANSKLLENLEILWISNLPIFKSVHSTGRQFKSIRNLKQLYIDCCPQLTTLFMASQLPNNLEILHVKFCEGLQHLCETKEEFTLDRLHSLNLVELPEFEAVGLKLPSLKTVNIKNCPKLIATGNLFGLKNEKVGQGTTREKWDGSEIIEPGTEAATSQPRPCDN